MTLAYWHWLVFGMLLAGIEIFVPTFTILWFGLGALLVGLLMLVWTSMPLVVQVLLWTVGSAGFTWLWFHFFKRIAPDRTKAGLSGDAILGEIGMVISTPSEHRRGELRFSIPLLGADEWHFICEEAVEVGDRVRVQSVSGNTLIVCRV